VNSQYARNGKAKRPNVLRKDRLCLLALLAGMRLVPVALSAPFAIQGPGVNPAEFRISVFATNLYFPIGMGRLSDGSMLVGVSQGANFWSAGTVGQILRLTDTNRDGIADGPGTILYTGLPGGQSSLRVWGKLIFVTGQGAGQPISILRMGATPDAPSTLVGKININYPSGDWAHPHSALGVRPSTGQTSSCDLLFQLGSDQNFAKTTQTATISSAEIPGASGTLQGESIYMLTLTDNGTNVVATNLTRIAMGLRNPAGFAFHPVTGDLYFEDNGIDGLSNPNEPLSADELNLIPAAQIGNGSVPDFGFPTHYTAYRTGAIVGGGSQQPLVAFQPLPDPVNGSESEGPNDIAFAPPGFPDGLNNGIFVGFHGKWSLAGIANEENPLVFVDLSTTNYFQFIGNDEPNIGHLDGLMSTEDSLFVADLTATGDTYTGGHSGVIYQIKSLISRLSFRLINNTLELTWPAGVLQRADDLSGPWQDVTAAASPYSLMINLNDVQAFFRTRN
jgi:glucose/arabinose dehydrogenase